MMIPLRSYDFAAATRQVHELVSPERGLAFDAYSTDAIRSLRDVAPAVRLVGSAIVEALATLPIGEGGAATGEGAWVHEVRPELPLVRALMIARGHPRHGAFGHLKFDRPGQAPIPEPWRDGPHDIGPVLERFYAADPQPWDLARLEAAIIEGACAAYGDEEVDPSWRLDQIYPGSRIYEYTFLLFKIALFDAFGAFDPSFSRRDALSGEWWLLQPVSPRLDNWQLADRVELKLAGYLPQSHVDAPGRVVMACYPRAHISDDVRMRRIEDSKWIAGVQKVMWTKDRPPLSDPGFELVPTLEGVTESSYGPYRHSSELPPFGAPADSTASPR
jgi:hypothetical protein